MIRSSLIGVNTLTARNLNVYDHLLSNGPHIQIVRWKRKPMWLPTAKSKVFRIPKRPDTPMEEMIELKRLHNNYRTLMKSLRVYFIEQEEQKKTESDKSALQETIDKDFEVCSYLNDKWNKQTALARMQRLAEERTKRIQEIYMKVEAKKERDIKILENADLQIRKAKEDAETFITEKNIDSAILSALENIVDHNQAIDLNGNFHSDKSSDVRLQQATN